LQYSICFRTFLEPNTGVQWFYRCRPWEYCVQSFMLTVNRLRFKGHRKMSHNSTLDRQSFFRTFELFSQSRILSTMEFVDIVSVFLRKGVDTRKLRSLRKTFYRKLLKEAQSNRESCAICSDMRKMTGLITDSTPFYRELLN